MICYHKLMTNSVLIRKTAAFIKERLLGEGSGHDWWHIYRVWQVAKAIAKNEPDANLLVVELGALLHDIADWKFADGDIEAGPRAAREWLVHQGVHEATIKHIEDILRNVSFKGAKVKLKLNSLETKIVSDADKLDAIGAIGIARTFAYGGSKNRSMYEPDHKPTLHDTFEAYKSSNSPTINHFYEKLLLLKDMMQTETGKQMAEHRHKYMEQFLDEFYGEWEGKV